MPVTRRSLYRGRIVDFGIECIAQPDGRILEVEVARHPGGAAVVAVDSDQRVCLLRQFRSPLEEWLWEIPAGKVDPPESARATAERELEEEAGLRARRWESLGSIVTCPGFCDEVIHLFLACDLTPAPRRTEADEYLEVHWRPLQQAAREALAGVIRDGKSVVALLRAARVLGAPGVGDRR